MILICLHSDGRLTRKSLYACQHSLLSHIRISLMLSSNATESYFASCEFSTKMTFIEISEIGQNPKVVWFAGPFISDGRYIPECKTNFHFYLWFSSLISVQYAEW